VQHRLALCRSRPVAVLAPRPDPQGLGGRGGPRRLLCSTHQDL
ncbi:MAG: hypothetical protein AVDCRST_MAG47-346, partial [uncultured Nocardioidaceae bacterium]